MEEELLKFVNSYDKKLLIAYDLYHYNVMSNKDELYVNFANQNISKLIRNLKNDFNVKLNIINRIDGFICYEFYIPNDFEIIEGIYNVETKVHLVSRNKYSVFYQFIKSIIK